MPHAVSEVPALFAAAKARLVQILKDKNEELEAAHVVIATLSSQNESLKAAQAAPITDAAWTELESFANGLGDV